MKKRMFITPLLSAMFALAAFGQQSNSSSTAQPTPTGQTVSSSQSAATAEKEPLEPAAPQDFWDGDEPSLGALLLHPMASKAYVKRHVQPIRDRVNELEELTETHSKMIKDVDSRAQQGIQLASAKASVADGHAQEAASKAQAAQQKATALDTRLDTDEKAVGNIDQYKSGAQTEIRFRAGQTVLSKEAKEALDEMAGQLTNQRGYIIEVQGFAAGQSPAAIANSRKMADSVARYLVLNHEIPAYRIYVIALGNPAGSKSSGGTRIEVNLLKNDIAQVAKQ
ncbi:MAG: outer membrane protein OmpA/MotB family [Candidatus Sulfotelmatobacter sp.]|nr:outer membrane protein OmpA/MotB family [Candidatus Sulfotelmatobacter sp.]